MSEESKKEQPFENAIEVLLNATPEVLSPIIRTVSEEFTFEGWEYAAQEEVKSASLAFRRLLIKVIEEEKDEGEEISGVIVDRIGVVTLQLLGESKTLFRVPPRCDWRFVADTRILGDTRFPGYAGPRDFNWFADESPFTHLLARLFAEFQRLGFIDFKKEKPPLGFPLPHREKNA